MPQSEASSSAIKALGAHCREVKIKGRSDSRMRLTLFRWHKREKSRINPTLLAKVWTVSLDLWHFKHITQHAVGGWDLYMCVWQIKYTLLCSRLRYLMWFIVIHSVVASSSILQCHHSVPDACKEQRDIKHNYNGFETPQVDLGTWIRVDLPIS